MHYTTYCINDSFQFAGFIKNCYSQNKLLCSFDICRLFTCVPILETINICADMLYRSHLPPPPKFRRLCLFSFDNIMYRQVDGISMGSVLGPTMAGIFMGFHEVDLFSKGTAPDVTHSVYLVAKLRLANFFQILINCTLPFDLLWKKRVIPHFLFLMF